MDEWIGPFDIVFARYYCGIFVPVSFVFYKTFLCLAIECWLLNAVN